MATHSPILMAYPKAKLLFLDGGAFTEVNYKKTPHYAITRRFLENPERYLAELQPTNKVISSDA